MTTRLEKGRLYTHPSSLDVDFYVTRIKYQGPKYTIFDVTYFHKKYRYVIESEKNVKIFKKDLAKWVEIA